MTSRAAAAYQNAIRYEHPDSMAHFYLAQQLHNDGKYAPAIKSYENFLNLVPNHNLSIVGIRGCNNALKLKSEPSRYIVKPVKIFNSRRADFSPMFLGADFDQLYFTSSNEKATGEKKSEITGMKKSAIFFSKKNEKGEWQRPELAEGELNSEFDDGITSFSPDGSTMYFSRARRSPNAGTSVEIYTSQRSEAKWSTPVKYEITADTPSVYGDPADSRTGRFLCFSMFSPCGLGGDAARSLHSVI